MEPPSLFHHFTISPLHPFTISPLSLSSFPNCPWALHHIRKIRLAFAKILYLKSRNFNTYREHKQTLTLKAWALLCFVGKGFDSLRYEHGNCPTLIFLYQPCRRDKAALQLCCYEKNCLCTRVRVVHAACFTRRRAGACLRSHRRARGLVAV